MGPKVGLAGQEELRLTVHMGGWHLLWLNEEYCAACMKIDGDLVWVWIGSKDRLPDIL